MVVNFRNCVERHNLSEMTPLSVWFYPNIPPPLLFTFASIFTLFLLYNSLASLPTKRHERHHHHHHRCAEPKEGYLNKEEGGQFNSLYWRREGGQHQLRSYFTHSPNSQNLWLVKTLLLLLPHHLHQSNYDFVIAAHWPLWQKQPYRKARAQLAFVARTKWGSDGCLQMSVGKKK